MFIKIVTMNIRQKIGKQVHALRMRKGWSEEELAEKSGLRAGNIYSIEAGRYAVNVDVLQRLAETLGAEVGLIDGTGKAVDFVRKEGER